MDKRAWTLIAGFGIFTAVMLLLSDVAPKLAYLVLAAAMLALLVNHSADVTKLVGQYSSARKGA